MMYKRITALILILWLSLSLAACAGGQATGEGPPAVVAPEDTRPPTATIPETAPAPETIPTPTLPAVAGTRLGFHVRGWV